MAEDVGKEISSNLRLPLVDRQAVHDLFIGKDVTYTDRISEFYKNHPEFEQSIMFGFQSLSEEDRSSIYIGAGIAAILLAESQPRTGGMIPEELNQDVINASIKSGQEREGTAFNTIEDLMDMDKELFLALTYLSVKMKVNPSPLLQGGHLLLQIYDHVLKGKGLEQQLGY